MHSLIALSSINKQAETDNLVASLPLFNKFCPLLSPEVNRQNGNNVVPYANSVLQLFQMVCTYIYLLAILNLTIIAVTAITVNIYTSSLILYQLYFSTGF